MAMTRHGNGMEWLGMAWKWNNMTCNDLERHDMAWKDKTMTCHGMEMEWNRNDVSWKGKEM
jgi:hypothetical protein